MNRDELSVYADELQIQGDIRGEIIALELAAPRADLEARREALMQSWLGFDPRGWRDVRFTFAFADVRSVALERVLQTPAGPYIRSLFVSGTNTEIVHALRTIASAPRPHLVRLSISAGRRFGERRAPNAPFVVDTALAADLVRATPNLACLDVGGTRVLESFPHPAVQRVRAIGHDAIAALVEAGPAMPSVRELCFAFTADPFGYVAFTERGLPRTLFARATLPALTRLDVSPNELQRSWVDRVVVFELLSEFGVLPQLVRLDVPTIHHDEERALLDHARALMPALEHVQTANELPGPLHDLLEPASYIGITIQNHDREHRLWMRPLGEMMSALWATFDDATRTSWRALWGILAGLPPVPDDLYEYRELPRELCRLSRLAVPLASLGDRVDDDFGWAELAGVVARSREAQVSLRRFPT